MNNSGSGLVIAVIIVLVLLLVGVALFFVPVSAGPGGGTTSAAKFTVSATLTRTPAGVDALVTVAAGPDDLKNVRISKVAIRGMTGAATLPLKIGRVPPGGRATVTVPFTGPAPAPNAPVQVEIDYDYEFGWRGQGSGSSGVTSVLP